MKNIPLFLMVRHHWTNSRSKPILLLVASCLLLFGTAHSVRADGSACSTEVGDTGMPAPELPLTHPPLELSNIPLNKKEAYRYGQALRIALFLDVDPQKRPHGIHPIDMPRALENIGSGRPSTLHFSNEISSMIEQIPFPARVVLALEYLKWKKEGSSKRAQKLLAEYLSKPAIDQEAAVQNHRGWLRIKAFLYNESKRQAFIEEVLGDHPEYERSRGPQVWASLRARLDAYKIQSVLEEMPVSSEASEIPGNPTSP